MRVLKRALVCLCLCGLDYCFAGTIETPAIMSTSMRKAYRASVIIPESYKKNQARYNVIYLLHGYSGDNTTWLRMAPLPVLSDRYSVMFVCIDGDYNSWYLDSPIKSNSRFETYVTREVIAFIDSAYRTVAFVNGRSICGSSMGGHGALTLLAKHLELYAAGSSISGVFDLTEFPKNWEISEVLGPLDAYRQSWIEHSFVGCVPRLVGKNKGIMLDCGLQDFALPGNLLAHELLTKNNIVHSFHNQPGTHSPGYVSAVFESHVKFLIGSMRAQKR